MSFKPRRLVFIGFTGLLHPFDPECQYTIRGPPPPPEELGTYYVNLEKTIKNFINTNKQYSYNQVKYGI